MMYRLLAAFSLCLMTGLPAAAQECSEKIASFDLVQTASGDIVIPVMFGDTPGHMALDFQGLESAVYAKSVDKLHLPVNVMGKRFEVKWFGERVTKFAEVPSVSIGKAPSRFKAFVLDQTGPDQLDGWFGLSLLAGVDVDIDFGNRKIAFFTPNACPAKQVVTWTENFQTLPLTEHYRLNFDFPVEIEGHTIQMSILHDLASGAVLRQPAQQVLGLETTSPGMVQETEPDTYSYSFKSLKAGGIELANPKLSVIWRPEPGCVDDRCWNEKPGGYLSLNQFRSTHVYIAYRAKKMYLSVSDPKPAQGSATSVASQAH